MKKIITSINEITVGRTTFRLAYIIPATIFLWLFIGYSDKWTSESSFQLTYFYLLGSVMLIFTYQSIRNSILGWLLVFWLYLIYGFWLCQEFQNWWRLIPAKSDPDNIYNWLLFGFIYLLIGLFYWLIRPYRRYI
jgi:hypothetical protein